MKREEAINLLLDCEAIFGEPHNSHLEFGEILKELGMPEDDAKITLWNTITDPGYKQIKNERKEKAQETRRKINEHNKTDPKPTALE